MARREREREEVKVDDGIKSKLVAVNRVSKTVKGGRNMRFSALVVVGDGNGSVGMGMAKAAEVPEAIKKAEALARRDMVKIPLSETTIPHEGTGVIAGSSARSVVELAGIRNITTMSYGSRNPINCVKATMAGLRQLRSPEQIAAMRGKSVEEILG